MKRQYTIYNICVLLALLFLGGGWNDAWGQGTIDVDIQSITASSTENSNRESQISLGNGNTWTSYTTRNGRDEDESPYLILDLGNSHEDVNRITISFEETRPAGMSISYSDYYSGDFGWTSINYIGDVENVNTFLLGQSVTARYIRLEFERGGGWGDPQAVSISDLSLAYAEISIIPQTNNTFPQENVPTLVDTVYVDENDSEPRLLQAGNYEYYWYFRWYRLDESGNGTIDRIAPLVEDNYLWEAKGDDPSYFWVHNMNNVNQSNHVQAARINYTGNGAEDVVYCDVSFNVDGLGLYPSGPIFTEPTIGKRYKFIIKPASEIKKRLDDFINNRDEDTPMQIVRITVPQGATGVNLQMDLDPQSYFWGNSQGERFSYTISQDETWSSTRTSSSKLIELGDNYEINNETTVNVHAQDGGDESPCLVRFILTPQADSDFTTVISDERNPAGDPDKYAQIGVVDFDYGDAIPRRELDRNNNMRSEPVDPSSTTYSFADPDLPWISERDLMPEDAYGLYRSAMVSGISERRNYGDGWAVSYDPDASFVERTKSYGWYYNDSRSPLYDRTYYNTDRDSCGYFYYVNASAEAGRVVTIPIEGTICPNTELIVTAWVADITNAATRPNVSLVLRGVKTNERGERESVVLHRFSSGAMKGSDRATWKQLCYRITVTSEIASYSDFVVDFANSTPNSNGGDYAIDDIRIYRTLPNIEVYRENACDAATLIVSTDYETILRNMGWTEGQDVITAEEYNEITDATTDKDLREILDKRKYRYGLMGDDPENPQHLNSVVGNVYFAFLSFDDKNNNGKIDADEESSVVWQSVNNAIVEENPDLNLDKVAKTIRIAVPTEIPSWNESNPKFEFFTRDRVQAIKNGQIMNYRAIQDYNHDIAYWEEIEGKDKHPGIIEGDNINPLDESGNDNPNFDEANYNKAIRTLYARLGIPRLRCPWYYTEGTGQNRISKLYLGIIDVDNTDLKYQDEPLPDGGKASGEYWVVTFSAEQVVIGGETSVTDFDDCTLMSPFTVQPATTITVETMTDATTALCLNAVRKITPTLSVYDPDTNEPVKGFNSYIFDWYLGSEEEFKALTFGDDNETLDVVLQAYRNRGGDTDSREIDPDNFCDWMTTSGGYSEDDAAKMKQLFDDHKLLTGTKGGETLIIEITSEDYIAMPYVRSESANNYVYCTDWTRVHFDITGNDIPDFYVGLRLADRPVALRLGRRHLKSGQTLTIPVSTALRMAEEVDHFGLAEAQSGDREANPVYVVINGVYTQIGQLTELSVPRPEEDANGAVTDATLKIQWYKEALDNLHEGEQYILRIPFVQVDSKGKVMDSECDGWAYFPVKVVPEYLTWKGSSSNNWYDESEWNQSTEGELYFDQGATVGTSTEDANGTDADLTKAFSPLYFTKITIPGSSNELALFDVTQRMDESDNRFLASWATDNSDTIRYEMAIDTLKAGETGLMANHTIRPYYINKVDQIYFKPNASLYRQDYLTYNKAWVDFEMEANTPYWMSAPLQNVYAGDMYAPSSNGRQETEAFEDITYNGVNEEGNDLNSRWSPAFYQKAWNKAIAYVNSGTSHDANNATDVTAVKSNWSIEYNDVWVPYSEGKGFYARVEDLPGNSTSALVRLPKADKQYSYETKAAGNLSNGENISRDNAYDLLDKVEGETGQDIVIALDTEVDGNGTHFLVGNPYMAYLDMKAFFDNNPNLNRKFWTLDRKEGSIVVGTPDISGWSGNDVDGYHDHTVESTQSYVAPMTAFFVELNDNAGDDKTIEFTTAMMAAKPTTTDNVYTKSYSASNPILTLTAERGETRSVARLLTSDKGHDEYEASEDAVLLLDSELDAPMVYTVAGDVAAQFNTLRSIKNVPLGIYNKKGDEVTLTISGLSRLVESLYLYDAWTGKSRELTGDSYQLTVEGESLGRYYLRNEALASELESTISIYSFQPGEIVAASSGAALRQVRVYGVNGELVTQRSAVGQTACRLSVPRGAIYMIYAEDTKGNSQSVKLRVR